MNYILIDASRRTEEEGRDVLLLFSIDIMRPSRGGKWEKLIISLCVLYYVMLFEYDAKKNQRKYIKSCSIKRLTGVGTLASEQSTCWHQEKRRSTLTFSWIRRRGSILYIIYMVFILKVRGGHALAFGCNQPSVNESTDPNYIWYIFLLLLRESWASTSSAICDRHGVMDTVPSQYQIWHALIIIIILFK